MIEVIDDDVLDPFYLEFCVKLLKKEDPTDELGLRVLLEHKVSKCRMVSEYDHFGHK